MSLPHLCCETMPDETATGMCPFSRQASRSLQLHLQAGLHLSGEYSCPELATLAVSQSSQGNQFRGQANMHLWHTHLLRVYRWVSGKTR